MPEVVLDPGHGGSVAAGSSTPYGCSSPGGWSEKDLVLRLAHDVATRLPAARVALTRGADVNLSLQQRRATTHEGTRAFVSLHASARPSSAEVWVHPAATSASRALAQAVSQALRAPLRSDAPMAILDPRGLGRDLGACLVEADLEQLEREHPGRFGAPIAAAIQRYLEEGAGARWTGLSQGLGHPSEMDVSDAGLGFITGFEGFRAALYNDAAGHCTIGIGHLVHHGACNGSESAEFRAGITEDRARQLLRDDASTAVRAVGSRVTVDLNQAQFDALVSFVFNIGDGNFQTSTLLRRLNAGEYAAVPEELNRWVHAGGKVLPGLQRRREAEGRLFSQGSYGGAMAHALVANLHYGVPDAHITDPFYRNSTEKRARSGRTSGRSRHLGMDVSLDNTSGGGVDDRRRGLPVYAVVRTSIPLAELNTVLVSADGDREQTGLGLSGSGDATLREGRVRVQPWRDDGNAYGGVVGLSCIYDYTGQDGTPATFTLYLEYLHLITREFPPKDGAGTVQSVDAYTATGKGIDFGPEIREGAVIPASRLSGSNPILVGYLGATEFPHLHMQAAWASGVSRYARRPRLDPSVVVPA